MKKEIIMIAVTFIIIIILDIFLTKNIDKKIDYISGKLEKLQEKVIEKNEEQIKEEYEEIDKEWEKIESVFSFYLEHDELEKVGVEMKSIGSRIETKEWNEASNEVQRLQFILEHLKDKMDVKLKNIF